MSVSLESPAGAAHPAPAPEQGGALARGLEAALVPHGYTLSVWGVTAALAGAEGLPSPARVVAFVVGASCMFQLLRLAARRRPRSLAGGATPAFGVPVASVLAVFSVAALAPLFPGELAWPLAGAGVTGAYFVTVSALATREMRR